jgi:Flp pilus assembly protein TadB
MTTDRARAADADRPGVVPMLEEVADLAAGLGILLLPLFATALPGIIVFLILPAVVLLVVVAVPVVLFAAVAVPVYLLVRSVRRPLQAARGRVTAHS